ncbi:cell filamentation protein Fic [Bifidobacterium sp. ESL0690]|uniref:cell filamentation protein Fic n=1 Tax=Bifidobacterium sp. ESL0690 TaxID=2983214 RepID=UPI0023F8EC20|nr:cell filamentation protein Fic [Bifidobacterium sp. ESL0690]WEV46146.1 cell filamentation protein Fic [Bifidobacterium sp. ESL0690]
MTPAERASAVAFSYKNCELSAIVPSNAMVAAANGYQRGTLELSDFVRVPENQTKHRKAVESRPWNTRSYDDDESPSTKRTDPSIDDDSSGSRAKKRDESQLRDDRIFARSVRLIDYEWPASGGLDELKIIHRGLFVGAMAGAGKLRDDINTGELLNDAGAGKSRSDNGSNSDDGNAASRGNGRATNQSNCNDDLQTRQYRQQQSPYFPSPLIETGAANIFSQLDEGNYFAGLDRAGFIRALASIYDELNALRPFAYGNGMVLRMFISELTHAVGWDLNWGTVTCESYRNATDLALLEHDISGLERMFGSITRLANPTRIFLISGWDQGPAH